MEFIPLILRTVTLIHYGLRAMVLGKLNHQYLALKLPMSAAALPPPLLAGNYTDSATSRFEGPPIILPTTVGAGTMYLRFWHWFDFYPSRLGANTCPSGVSQDYGDYRLLSK